jgi:predicted Zn finger-like uncharacterized protein
VYTQCPKCETVFKLSAEVLRAASGQVRCGKCGDVFNALARLAEDSGVFTAGESPLDMETRADSILESVIPLQVAQDVARDYDEFGPPGVEIAHLEILDTSAEDIDRSMEFTLPPGELDRIFVESKKRAPQPVLPFEPQPDPLSSAQPEPPPEQTPPQVPAPHPEAAVLARNRISGLEVPDEVRRDMLEGLEQGIQPPAAAKGQFAHRDVHLDTDLDAARNARRRLIYWLGAAIVSAMLLIAQIMHQNREWFVAHAHGPFGAAVHALYAALGTPLPAPANLSGYQLRQWGVTGDPDANGTLRVRASIMNSAAQPQPYPLLRVTLADRFGKNIGARDFAPAEYLGKPTAGLLAPGERVDATLEILDPGKNAEGFEIDVCLRGVDQKIACANDVAPQAKR